jgi:hypothetical protein
MATTRKHLTTFDRILEYVPDAIIVRDISDMDFNEILEVIENNVNEGNILYFSMSRVYKHVCTKCRERLEVMFDKEHNLFHRDNHIDWPYSHMIGKHEILSWLEYEAECPVCFDDSVSSTRVVCHTCGKGVCKSCVDDLIGCKEQLDDGPRVYDCPICNQENTFSIDGIQLFLPKRSARKRARGKKGGKKGRNKFG